MARLKDAPKQAAPKPSTPSSDDNAATQQLLAESNSPSANPPSSSAVLGANLLNAARPGKLKRVSILPEGARQNLAIRGDPYEIELSPEKGRYALPLKVNHKPLKINRKKKEKKKPAKKKVQATVEAVEERSDVPAPSSELPVHHDAGPQVDEEERVEDLVEAEPDIRSSPPELAPPEHTPSKAAPPIRDNGVVDPTGTTILDGEPAGAEEDNSSTRRTSKRKSESDHSEEQPSKIPRKQRRTTGESSASRKSHPQVRIPVRRSSQQQDVATATGHDDIQSTREAAEVHSAKAKARERWLLNLINPINPPARKLKPRKNRDNGTVESSQQLPANGRGLQKHAEPPKQAPEVADAPETEHAPVIDVSGDDSDEDDASSVAEEADNITRPVGRPGSLDAVFEFLNLEVRPGKCRTKLATTIRRACKTYRAHIQEGDLSMETVVDEADDLRGALGQISIDVEKKDQRAFKRDAYRHVFRALTLYLEALYAWLQDNSGDVTESLEAMKILSPLINQMLAFKDKIAEWNVSVPQRSKGDRIIKDVDIGLIAHLRQVSKAYRGHLSRLKAREEHRKIQEDFERKMQEREEEESRKAELEEARTQRWKRWQALHIVRLTCEPDARRRSKLAITRLEDLEERDANGVVFERLPVFTPRSAPPHRQASALSNKPEWTEQEETALLEGLRHLAGPQVFEKIFTTYCRPDSSHPLSGHLRDRSVAEIVTKAAQFRLDFQKLYQDNGWEIEEWITKIPVLP
ncbi:uncharacterized protein J4E78_010884 [Alternaria triticimaculans]|uniref:uncharacterized protein n=1 Tax=Alternaria triticimaculans TaxID=297637 RepID=UPI0020C5051F|nr:uncharacterized protein J4E78_010884 [Alternaria triticimaculans]KAI4639557.1 hypothetical protein J4E78_010884 [Alternaria triticimaculans]